VAYSDDVDFNAYDSDSDSEHETDEEDNLPPMKLTTETLPLEVGHEVERDLQAFIAQPILAVSRQLRNEALYAAVRVNVFTVIWVPHFHRFLRFLGPECWHLVRHVRIEDPFFPDCYDTNDGFTGLPELPEDKPDMVFPNGSAPLAAQVIDVLAGMRGLATLELCVRPQCLRADEVVLSVPLCADGRVLSVTETLEKSKAYGALLKLRGLKRVTLFGDEVCNSRERAWIEELEKEVRKVACKESEIELQAETEIGEELDDAMQDAMDSTL
jgi:hypothetical protein